jgi:hypothetical protein
MLRSIFILLVLFAGATYAQNTQDNTSASSSAATMLDEFINMRSDSKHSSTKQFSRTEQFAMDDWCYAMEKKYPDAYETSYAWFLNGHYYEDEEARIKDAFKKAPNDKRIVKAMFGYHLMKGEVSQAKAMSSKVGGYYSKNTLNYYKDVLPKSGYIIASSLEDAIPLYVLKLRDGLASNVTIVTMDFLINKDYLKRNATGLKAGTQNFFGDEKAYLKLVMNANKNVHLSSTVSQSYLDGNTTNCFLTGLSYQANPASQIALLESFWAKIAKKSFSSLSLNSSERRLYTNYLPPLLSLYKLQLARGNGNDTLKNAILALGEKVQQTKNVKAVLNDYE